MNDAARDMQDLYRELVIDHSRNPRHFGRLENATHTADGINPLCGDKLRLYFRVGAGGRIESSSFEGSGCAISIASASLLTEAVTGLEVDDAKHCSSTVTSRLTTAMPYADLDARLENLKALDGVRAYPSRVKCATLAWHALHAALSNDMKPATTE
ncbi:MAG: SUF system NifU family Fe-S cluster assembly protein [Chromatiales bacterium]|nr:MAG: SUF system NifU family Fe-S cluster assembly protein [Chromatiales bacterium]